MKSFNYHQTTKIIFGRGEINQVGQIVAEYGSRALLVTTPATCEELKIQYEKVKILLRNSGIEVFHFDRVVANPTTDTITDGAGFARDNNVDVIIGLGGGSSMDAAKAISVEATHEGSCWDYLFFKKQPDKEKLLPIIVISTTSGTGSQVTQVSVVTHTPTRDKSALYNNILYPEIAIVDPELMVTVPKKVTAATGFDVFCHAFESILNPGSNPMTNLLAWEAIGIVIQTLPDLLKNLSDVDLRTKMAYADTLAGLCIANSGVTLPHGIGMAVGGMYPIIAHGEALGVIYPAFADFTWKEDIPSFSRLARIFDSSLENSDDESAAQQSAKLLKGFLQEIGLLSTLKDYGVPEHEIEVLANQAMVLPDYKANPRVPTPREMVRLIREIY